MAGSGPGNLVQWRADDMAGLMDAISAMPGRRLPVPGTHNLRDVGGYPAHGGGVIGWRKLLRSDALHRVDPTGTGVLTALGLRTVLDLRTSYEADIAPSPLDDLARGGALTMHVSLIGDDLDAIPAELAAIYDYIVDDRGGTIGAAIRCLARPGALPGLVHCSAGKDRTGIVVAFALAVAGVPDHVVAADYALSSLYLDPRHTATIGQVRISTGLGDQLTTELLASPPDLIMRVLARARQQAGSIGAYLACHGVTGAELSALRSALVTDGERHDECG